MKNNSVINIISVALAVMISALPLAAAAAAGAPASDTWKDSFEIICSSVPGADALTLPELEDLVKKADKLLPEIEALDDPQKKLYVLRLKKCRSVLEFMIDTKKGPAAQETPSKP